MGLESQAINEPKSAAAGAEPDLAHLHGLTDGKHSNGVDAGTNQPIINALAGRLSYLGLTNQFSVGNPAVHSALANAGEPGAQLASRWQDLENHKWYVGPLRLDDPYVKETSSGAVSRLLRFLQVGGYHQDTYNGQTFKRLAYNNVSANLSGVLGMNNSPKAESAMKAAHELGHHNLTPFDFQDISKLSATENQVLARRLLFEETTAIWSQLWVAQENGLISSSAVAAATAFEQNQGGAFIKTIWTGSSPQYDSLKSMSGADANAFVSEVTQKLSTDGNGMFKAGKIQPLDLSKAVGMGQNFGTIDGDSKLLARMESMEPGIGYKAPLAESAFASGALADGLRGLGALGLAVAATDVVQSFGTSSGTGLGKLGRIGLNWASFDVGIGLGTGLGKVAATVLGNRFPFAYAVIPGISILSGLGLCLYSESKLGDKLQHSIQTFVDTAAPLHLSHVLHSEAVK